MYSRLRDITPELSTLCSKGLNERALKLVLQKWNKNKKSLIPSKESKCVKKAIQRIDAGNILFAISPSSTEKLLEIYTEAVRYAPTDSLELAKAYGNRSAVLSNAKMYEDSSKDIDRALALNYPDDLKAKLIARKARNLCALDAELSVIEETIAEARRWMIKLKDTDKKLLESRLNKLSTQKSFPKPFKKHDNSLVTPDILDPHGTLIGASSAIELKYSEEFGRHIVATRDIKAGETIIKQSAYASVIGTSLNSKIFFCWNCSKRTWACVPCKICAGLMFCDENCREEGWKNFHDIECRILHYSEKLNDELTGLKVTIRALKEMGSIEALKEKLQTVDLVSDPLTRGFIDGKYDGASYTSIYTLIDDVRNKFCEHVYVDWISNCALMLFVWANTSKIFGDDVDNMRKLINNESAMFIGQLLLKNTSICYNNAQPVYLYDETVAIARRSMVSGIIGCLNHSCDPNACIVSSGTTMVINCTQLIKKGEQIFICYEMIEDSRTNIRKFLKERYNIVCKCNLCQRDLVSNHPLNISIEDKILSRQARLAIDRKMIEFFKPHIDNGMAKDECIDLLRSDISYVSDLADLINTLINNAGYPCKDIWEFKDTLTINYARSST